MVILNARLASRSDCGGKKKLTRSYSTTLVDPDAHSTDGRIGLVRWLALRFDS
jgi:hypothetical protein